MNTGKSQVTAQDPNPGVWPSCPVVDSHVHLFPKRLFEAISEWFATEKSWSVPVLPPETVVERLQDRVAGFVFFPYAHRPGVSTSLNEMAAEWQSRLPEAVGLGTVHADDEDPAAVVAEAFEMGLQGVKIHCPVQGFSLGDTRLDPVYEILVSEDAPLIAHASTHPFYRGDNDLGPTPLSHVLSRFPNLRICIPHLGLFETAEFLEIANRYDNVYFDTAVALGSSTHDLIDVRDGDIPRKRLREISDQVMFGTDYPIRPQNYEAAFRGITEIFPNQKKDVFFRNAQDFFDASFGIQA